MIKHMNNTIDANTSFKNLAEERTRSYNQSQQISDEGTEKTKVLVYLDFNPYAFISFGTILELSKLDKFDFVGIVATKNDFSFFQNQKLLSFKKLMYYPDCYVNKSSFNLANLENFEKQYGLNLWLDVFNERYFYKYYTDFHKFKKDEILSIIENSISFFVGVLEEFKPELVLMQEPGENISNLLLYRLTKKMGIKILTPNLSYVHNKIIVSDNIDCREISDEFKTLISNSSNSQETYDEEFIRKHSLAKSMDILLSFDYGILNFFHKIKHYVYRLSHALEPLYMNIGKTRLKMIKNRYQTYLKVKKRKKFLYTNSIKSIENERFLYFPLQTEPEAIVLMKSPFYGNVVALIENIARSIPIDMVLYVKEHPVQREKLWRPIYVYQKIIDIPNVKLVHPNVNSQDVISKSQGVICLSGATGFEALFHKKPVILFSDEYYDVLSMVRKINSFTELPAIIRDVLRNFKFNNQELNTLMQAFNNQSISIPFFSIMKDGIPLSSLQKHGDFNLTIQYFQKFYNKYKDDFKLIAQTIYSKL